MPVWFIGVSCTPREVREWCCSVLQWVAVCCSVLQWIAVCCNVLQYGAVCFTSREGEHDLFYFFAGCFSQMSPVHIGWFYGEMVVWCMTIDERERNPLQHAATHHNTVQRTAIYCYDPQHAETHCNILQRTSARCIARCNTIWYPMSTNETHCNTL